MYYLMLKTSSFRNFNPLTRGTKNTKISLSFPTVVSVGFASAFYTAQEGQKLDVAVVKNITTPFSIIVRAVLLTDATAEANIDYVIATPMEIVIPSDSTRLLLPLAISCDEVKEDTEKFSLSLALSGGQRSVVLGSQDTTEIAIEDVKSEGEFPSRTLVTRYHIACKCF